MLMYLFASVGMQFFLPHWILGTSWDKILRPQSLVGLLRDRPQIAVEAGLNSEQHLEMQASE